MPARLSRMTRQEFEQLVLRALEELPEEFQRAMHNIDIQVRWRPTPGELRSTRVPPGGDLFGVYQGVPLPKRSSAYSMVAPDVIVIYQRAHELRCQTDEEIVEQARQTLFHEIGHYLGISEKRLRELGVG